MNLRFSRTRLVALVLGCLVLGGLATSGGAAHQADEITLGISPFQDTLLPIVAEKKGWFEAEDLNVKLKTLRLERDHADRRCRRRRCRDRQPDGRSSVANRARSDLLVQLNRSRRTRWSPIVGAEDPEPVRGERAVHAKARTAAFKQLKGKTIVTAMAAASASVSTWSTPHSQIQVEVLRFQIELRPQISDGFLQPHQREAYGFGLLRGDGARFHAADGLAFHELPQELHERQHQLHHRTLHVIGIGIPPGWTRALSSGVQSLREARRPERRQPMRLQHASSCGLFFFAATSTSSAASRGLSRRLPRRLAHVQSSGANAKGGNGPVTETRSPSGRRTRLMAARYSRTSALSIK